VENDIPNITYWNYRVVRRSHEGETWLAVHEAFYDNGTVLGVTKEAIALHGNDLEDLKSGHDLIKLAFDKPILDYETLKEVSDVS
jgi:hypothetical protein